MANPQKENGYTAVANEIEEALSIMKLNGIQFRILHALARYTYGFSRKECEMSVTFLACAVGSTKSHISKELSELINKKIIIEIGANKGRKSRILSLNKNYEEWNGYSEALEYRDRILNKLLQLQSHTCCVMSPLSKTALQPRNQDKQTVKQLKQTYNEHFSSDSSSNQTIPPEQELFDRLWKLYPEKKGYGKVSKKTKNNLLKIGFGAMAGAIERYKGTKPGWQNYMHGSTFFNSGYIDYLEPQDDGGVPAGESGAEEEVRYEDF